MCEILTEKVKVLLCLRKENKDLKSLYESYKLVADNQATSINEFKEEKEALENRNREGSKENKKL